MTLPLRSGGATDSIISCVSLCKEVRPPCCHCSHAGPATRPFHAVFKRCRALAGPLHPPTHTHGCLQAGVKVISMSLGGPSYSELEEGALTEARDAGILVVAAAGNERRSTDERPSYPASYNLENIVGVAAIAADDVLAEFR